MDQRKTVSFSSGVLVALLFINITVYAQPKQGLPRSTPEAEGISSEGILNFLQAAGESNIEFHSIMILRNGKVIAEGWWNPYRPDLKHTMYSVTKSWTSSAIGFAVSEKLLTVNDKVISFFPDQLPDTVSDHLKELRIKHLLSMTVGHNPDPTFNIVSQEDDWVKGFLSRTIEHKPGTKFLYNTMATYTLSAIIQKVTGKKVMDYLKPRLFDPLGITDVDSEVDPKGINTGGWGMRLRTEDMAKFGQLYLQRGKWNDKHILPESWIEEATTTHIEQAPHVAQAVKDSSEWLQGYGYQFWRTRHNAYRADGAYGQFIVVLPEKNMVVVLTAETPDMQRQINLVWEHILPAVQERPLSPNNPSAQKLAQQLKNLALPVLAKGMTSARVKDLSKKRIALEANDFGLESFSFSTKGDSYQITMKTKTETHLIHFGSGKWAFGETKKHGPYLLAGAKAKFDGLPPFKVAGAYSWIDANTLELTLRCIESPHTEKFTLRFDQDNVVVDVVHSFNPSTTVTILGKVQ
jgi:CubicO group peptidase (beta-lactamase class C family)